MNKEEQEVLRYFPLKENTITDQDYYLAAPTYYWRHELDQLITPAPAASEPAQKPVKKVISPVVETA